ncbi:MAG: DegT/DnrJ/EryC1/StrS family aminotransferase [Saprospiraceae bacterium]
MNLPFSRPLIDQSVLDEVTDCLLNTGWLTSGPKVLELERELAMLTGASAALCVNSWTSGAMLMLRWFGVGPGDEVIIPAYTYSATALCALNLGARVVMVDVKDDFTIDSEKLRAAITPRTKAIIPVDIGGWMTDYDAIMALVDDPDVKAVFQPKTVEQQKLGRILVLADAAHSIGAHYKGRHSGICADATVFSFHSVKNITTGEGGAICLHLPLPFDQEVEYKFLKAFALNGQTKSAFEKNQPGAWRYDIIAQGLKINMPDICAAIGLSQIRRYRDELLPERVKMFEQYQQGFEKYDWAILPAFRDEFGSHSSCHLYLLRIKNITEAQRDEIIQRISARGVGVNVHYIPMPLLTLFKSLGYRMEDYPNTYELYKGEISLPIYNGLKEEEIDLVIRSVVESVTEIFAES